MNPLKAILSTEMDAMSCIMDCRAKLAEIISDFNKALNYEREVNRLLEDRIRQIKRAS